MLQLLSLLESLRARQAQIDAARPTPLPSDSQLLADALANRHITAKRITEGRWIFEFRGNVIGGFANRVTTLVSAHSRRLLRDPAQLRAHLDLMEVPHAIEHDDASEQLQPMLPLEFDETDDNDDHPALLQAYCVGKEAVSVIAVVPDPEEGKKSLTVDVTDRVEEGIAQLAVSGMSSVPGLLAGAVNLKVRSLDTGDGGVVIGIDETASTVPHHYPNLGRGRAVADAVAEHILFTAAL